MYPEAVLFDLDGTLIDTAPDFIHVLNTLLTKYQRPPLPEHIIRNTVSNGAGALVTLGFDVCDKEPAFAEYRTGLLELYSHHLGDNSQLFPGMDTLLKKLESRQIPWGIVTNKPSKFTLPLLEALSLTQRCSALVCADQVKKPKPAPEALFKACTMLEVKPEKSIYVGDHQRDIEAGQRARMTTVAALFGYIPENENPQLWHAHHNANNATDIIHCIFGKQKT